MKLGIDGQPEQEPISTSRPRGNELPKSIPVLDNLPADVVAAAKGEPDPVPSVPPKAAEVPVIPEPVTAPAPVAVEPAVVATKAAPKTLLSEAEVVPAPVVPVVPEPVAAVASLADEGVTSRVSLNPAGGTKRKARTGNSPLTRSKSTPPPSHVVLSPEAFVAAPAEESLATAVVAASVEAPVGRAHEERVVQAEAPASVRTGDLDERFFDHDHEHGERGAHRDDHGDLESYDEKLAQKNSPEARARRAKYMQYVLYAVATCAILLLIAIIKGARGDGGVPEEPVAAVPSPANPPAPSVAAPAASATPAPAPSAAPVASASAAAAGSPAASASGKPADSAVAVGDLPKAPPGEPTTAPIPVVVPTSTEPTEGDRKGAAQEKHACQSLLDQGAFAKAVEAGERSVALDPSDGEAWLMLGAAYQSMGKPAEARRSFTACSAEAKRGPVNECRAMLR